MRLAAAACALGVLLCASLDATGRDTTQIELARRFMALREGVIEVPDGGGALSLAELADELNESAAGLLRRMRDGPDWSPAHPDWKMAMSIVHGDIAVVIESIVMHPSYVELKLSANRMMLQDIAMRFGRNDFEQMIEFHASPAGRSMSRFQKALFDDVIPTLTRDTSQGGSNEPPINFAGETNAEMRQVVGLYDEWIAIQMAIRDPGPGQDRGGLLAIAAMAWKSAAVNRVRYLERWQAIASSERAAILAWRDSALGRKEKQAVQEAAAGLWRRVDIEAVHRQLESVMTPLVEKWKGLVAPR